MLAADKLLLQSNIKQRTIQLREKELNLFNNNFSSVGTQSAVLAGFTVTALVEINITPEASMFWKALLHICTVTSICANLTCLTFSTLVSVWGSQMALRGKDGSVGEAVEQMVAERKIIFRAFGLGLVANLMSVMSACWLLMDPVIAAIASLGVLLTLINLAFSAKRIFDAFRVADSDVVNFDDITSVFSKFPFMGRKIRGQTTSTAVTDTTNIIRRSHSRDDVNEEEYENAQLEAALQRGLDSHV